MVIKASTFIEAFETFCPKWLAESGDPVGLQIGTLNKDIHTVMMALDIRPQVVAEAIEKKVDLIIVKHPPIFVPTATLVTDQPQEKMYVDLLKHDITVYTAHTNMDIIEGGLNDWFFEELGVETQTYLTKTHQINYQKLFVYTPSDHASHMRATLAKLGAGIQGEYEATSFTSIGQGRFTPSANAKPTIGNPGQSVQVQEAKIEVILPENIVNQVVEGMKEAHPYEEPAYDLFSINSSKKSYGLGRVGDLAEYQTLDSFIDLVKDRFGLSAVRLIEPFGQTQKKIKKIAICGGSGAKFYTDAINHGVDVFITGDISYHVAHDMQAAGLTAIDAGHHIEVLCIERFVKLFNVWKEKNGWSIDVIGSTVDTNPFKYR